MCEFCNTCIDGVDSLMVNIEKTAALIELLEAAQQSGQPLSNRVVNFAITTSKEQNLEREKILNALQTTRGALKLVNSS